MDKYKLKEEETILRMPINFNASHIYKAYEIFFIFEGVYNSTVLNVDKYVSR